MPVPEEACGRLTLSRCSSLFVCVLKQYTVLQITPTKLRQLPAESKRGLNRVSQSSAGTDTCSKEESVQSTRFNAHIRQ